MFHSVERGILWLVWMLFGGICVIWLRFSAMNVGAVLLPCHNGFACGFVCVDNKLAKC